MSAGLTARDRQTGLEQAWHRETNIVDVVTRENSMPYEIIEAPIQYRVFDNIEGFPVERIIEDTEYKRLIASDDFQPIGEPFAKSYCPGSIAGFWEIIRKGMGDTPYQVASAGTVDDRCKLFASIKVNEGFHVGDREFKDYITLIDSFDKTTSLQARYSNICVVCANTYAMVMNSGSQLGKAKHTTFMELNVERLIAAIDAFAGTSASNKVMLQKAYETQCSRDEARAWVTGIEGRNATASGLTNGMLQKTARIIELFDNGRGNEGRTRLDAFSAMTDFHSNESTNRKEAGSQRYTSEWGASAQTKNLVATRFEQDWTTNVRRGEGLLDRNLALTA
jgi:hypothetical protein